MKPQMLPTRLKPWIVFVLKLTRGIVAVGGFLMVMTMLSSRIAKAPAPPMPTPSVILYDGDAGTLRNSTVDGVGSAIVESPVTITDSTMTTDGLVVNSPKNKGTIKLDDGVVRVAVFPHSVCTCSDASADPSSARCRMDDAGALAVTGDPGHVISYLCF